MGPDPHHHRPGRGHWHGPRPRGIPAKRARPIRRGRGRAGTPRTREASDSPRVRGQCGLPIPVPDARIPQGQATDMGRGGVPMKITPIAADSLGARSMFRGKLAFLKDGKFHINRSQRERAGAFVRALKKYPKEIQVADGNQMDFGGTELLFSPALPHGYNDELGYVVMTRIAQGNEVFVHTADVLGPPLKEHLSFLIDAQPTVLYVDGPMTHMPDHYPAEHTKRSLSHLLRILRTTNVRTLILDHHILRDREWRTRMDPVFRAGKEHA